MAESAFAGAITLLEDLGVFEVVLPFFLVFTLVFAYLEKTKIFGTEVYKSAEDGETYDLPRKNLNAMTALTIAFLTVASSQLVTVISDIAANSVLVLMLGFSFTLVAGSFMKETDDGFYLEGTWKNIFMVLSFAGIALVFLNALDWLQPVIDAVLSIGNNEIASSVALLAVLGGFIAFIVFGSGENRPSEQES